MHKVETFVLASVIAGMPTDGLTSLLQTESVFPKVFALSRKYFARKYEAAC